MATSRTGILADADIEYILSLPEVEVARQRLDAADTVDVRVPVPPSTMSALRDHLGLDLNDGAMLPLRWIKGDTRSHRDVGAAAFERTHLIYLNDSPGEFIVQDQSYPIQRGAAYSFAEGFHHETRNTGTEPRLLLGPMSERGAAVGSAQAGVYYFESETEALNFGSSIYSTSTFVIETFNGISAWKIARKIDGDGFNVEPIPTSVFNTGDPLEEGDYRYLIYPAFPASADSTCCAGALEQKGLDYATRYDLVAGTALIRDTKRNVTSYDDYTKRLKALAGRK
jgi:hypothetical protein